MAIRILVLALVAALCLIAAAPKSNDVDGDGYGPQMVTEKDAPRAPSMFTSSGASVLNCDYDSRRRLWCTGRPL